MNMVLKCVTPCSLVDVTDASEDHAGSVFRAVPVCSHPFALARNVVLYDSCFRPILPTAVDSFRVPVTLSVFFYPKDRGCMFLRNVFRPLADYTTSYLRRLICMQIHYQLCNKIIMVLREILSMHALVAGNTYSASRLICQH
jgi:hypothetical protein